MLIYVLQIREAIQGRPSVLIGFACLATVVWAMWLLRVVLSWGYRSWTKPHSTTASIIVPVVDEPIDLFTDVLERIAKQLPHEVIVVINGERNVALEEACLDLGVTWTWTETAGKRNAVSIGVGMATGDIAVLVDSDTLWTDDTLSELLKPFADPRVGGVSTKQRIHDPRRSFFTRWADWMENSRALYAMPAQSALGYVGCLPGRTIAFRRHILNEVMHDFLHARFLGAHLEVSDDRHLTNLTLKAGYQTVYQATSLVYTDAPTNVKKLFKQQLRWARGCQYNHLRMLPWAAGHAPVLVAFFVADIILPFLLLGSLFGWAYSAYTHTGVNFTQPLTDAVPGVRGWILVAGCVVIGSTVSMWLRQHRHLAEVPRDFLWMPLYVLFASFFLMPVRLLGFVLMGHVSGWGTRANAFAGAKHRLNPWATIPYLLAATLIGAEIVVLIRV